MDDTNNLFLLGAGFDKAIFSDIALNGGLLSEIRRLNKHHQLAEHLGQYQETQIEHYLTKLDLEIAASVGDEKCRLERLREEINKLLVSYFSAFRFQESIFNSNNWLGEFAKTILKENDAIVTLNYSCFLDGLLDWFEVWSPNGGYSDYVANCMTGSVGGNFPKNSEGKFKNILLYKIHGSEHFIEAYVLPDKKRTFVSFEVNNRIFPRIAANSDFGLVFPLKIKGHIIAPSFVKVPHAQLLRLTAEVLRKASEAKKFVIIGCGLRPEDNNVWLLLASFLLPTFGDPTYGNKKLMIFDREKERSQKSVKETEIKNLIKTRLGIRRDDFCEVNLDGFGEGKSIEELKKFLSV